MILYYQNTPHILPKKQLQIVDFLAHNRSLVCTYEMFKEYVWFGEEIEEGTIRAEINRLKKNLKEDFIVNVRGMGYMVDF
jgi:DNA-binding response OmpR family regulator